MCDAGRVLVDGLPAKAARQVRVGNRITLDLFRRQLVIEVREIRGVGGGRGKSAALYTVVAERRSGRGAAEWGEEAGDANIHG